MDKIYASGQALIDDVSAAQPPGGRINLWWLGQHSFILKLHPEIVIFIDPYLSPSPHRLVPPLLEPKHLAGARLIIGTHDHIDHIDRAVWPELAEVSEANFVVPEYHREDLIDKLLSSPDYVSNMYNFWADTLRLVERPQPNIVADPFLGYVKDSIRTNKKYDQWVYEMLTADGKTWENPAVGFQLRDDGMPLPYIDNTVRVFLGTQIGCAQCHDHPFDQWTQYQFYELAAFTAGTRTRIQRGSPGFKTPGNGKPEYCPSRSVRSVGERTRFIVSTA